MQNTDWLVTHHPLSALEVYTGASQAVSEAESFLRPVVLEYLLNKQPRLAILYLVSIHNSPLER